MSNLLAPVAKAKFFDNNGRPAAGYKLFTYEAGTSTKLATYTDETTGTPNSNPIVLDYRGEANIWMPPNVAYKLTFSPPNDSDPPTAPIWTVDNIIQSPLLTVYAGTDTGTTNAYVVNFVSNFSTYEDGILLYFLVASQNTGASTLNVNGLGAVPILDPLGQALTAGMLTGNQLAGVMYLGGNFYLTTITQLAGSFNATLSGMTTPTVGVVRYRFNGGVVSLTADNSIHATSNSTSLSITGLPAPLWPTQAQNLACASVRDNGVDYLATCTVSAAGVIQFGMSSVSGSKVTYSQTGFTNSGQKGISNDWQITYQI